MIGEDIAQTEPDALRVEEALERCELVVCQELFLSGTARRADVVLPAASFLEKEGPSSTSTAASSGPGRDHAPGRGRRGLRDRPPMARALVPEFAGISHPCLAREGALHSLCPSPAQPGRAALYRDRFATPDGRARLADPDLLPSGEETDADYPLLLSTGRRLQHDNSGSMTARTPSLQLAPDERLEIHPANAGAAGVCDGDRVEVASRRGAIALRARLSERARPARPSSPSTSPRSPPTA